MTFTRLWGTFYDDDTYHKMIAEFSEAFAHSSLSVERGFNGYKDSIKKLNELNNDNKKIYLSLPADQQIKIDKVLQSMILYITKNSGMIKSSDIDNPIKVYETFKKLYKKISNNLYDILIFDNNKFDAKKTIKNIYNFYSLSIESDMYKKEGTISKKAHLVAFNYALSIDMEHLTLEQIKTIGKLVNGYKMDDCFNFRTSNNAINGANFDTADKSEVTLRLNDLLINYQKQWQIKDQDVDKLDEEEKLKYRLSICEKIARFHILFERIHPFDDGNGRTGRIIANAMMIQNGLSPALITNVMRNIYLKFIENKDYQSLGELFLSSSSQVQTIMFSINRYANKIPNEDIVYQKK